MRQRSSIMASGPPPATRVLRTNGYPVYGGCQTVTLPYSFDFSGSTTSLTPTDPFFIVEPSSSGNASGTIQVTFGFDYDSTLYNLVENVAFTANPGTDFDSLIWQAGSNGTCNGSATNDHCTYDFSIAGQGFGIEMDNETDWNMAEFDAATLLMTPARVPEPASVAMFGAGLLGLGMFWRRRRQKMTATAV